MKIRSALLLLVSAAFAACGGSGGGNPVSPPSSPPPPPPPPPTAADVSGTWFMQSYVDTRNCGEGEFLDGWSADVSQNGSAIELLDSVGNVFNGTVGDTAFTYSGSYPEDGGTTTIDTLQLNIAAGGDVVTGVADWSWSGMVNGGNFSCGGTTLLYGSRDGAEQDTEVNDEPANAQSLGVITNDHGLPAGSTAGWVVGSVEFPGGDEFDGYLLQVDTRSALEVELSHFDTAMHDLDLMVFDSMLNEIAFSDSSDWFEIIEIQLDPGTYYVVVEAFDTDGAAAYTLSVDLNPL